MAHDAEVLIVYVKGRMPYERYFRTSFHSLTAQEVSYFEL
jgi:hypothetical protein